MLLALCPLVDALFLLVSDHDGFTDKSSIVRRFRMKGGRMGCFCTRLAVRGGTYWPVVAIVTVWS